MNYNLELVYNFPSLSFLPHLKTEIIVLPRSLLLQLPEGIANSSESASAESFSTLGGMSPGAVDLTTSVLVQSSLTHPFSHLARLISL